MKRALKQNVEVSVKDAHSISDTIEYRSQHFIVEVTWLFIQGNFFQKKSLQKIFSKVYKTIPTIGRILTNKELFVFKRGWRYNKNPSFVKCGLFVFVELEQ